MKCVWISEHDNLQSVFHGNAIFCLLFFKPFNGVEIERLGDTYHCCIFPVTLITRCVHTSKGLQVLLHYRHNLNSLCEKSFKLMLTVWIILPF